MDIFTKKAKVRSQQKKYSKNRMLMQKSKDIRANVNADLDANTIAHEVANSNANSFFFCEFKLHYDRFKLQFTLFEFL